MKQIVVVGAGFGGLATAIRLRATGARVIVLELQDRPGGRAAGFHQDGYYFDAGPTVVTDRSLLEDLWRLVDHDLESYVRLVPLETYYRMFFADGSTLDVSGDLERMEARIERFSPGEAAGYPDFLEAVNGLVERAFPDGDHHSQALEMLRSTPGLVAAAAWMPLYYFTGRYFRDERLRQVFSAPALFIGANPFRTPAIYSVLPGPGPNGMAYSVEGGMTALVRAMTRLFTDSGGEVVFSANVREILIENGRASAAILEDGRVFRADAIVSNADLANTYRKMIPAAFRHRYSDDRLERFRYSTSCFLLYLGTNRTYPMFERHNIVLHGDFRESVRSVFVRGTLPEHPFYYVHIPTRGDRTMAPEGGESIFVQVPVPHQQSEIDWSAEAPRLRARILSDLEAAGMTQLRQSIVVERIRTPDDFADDYQATFGNAFAFQSGLRHVAYFHLHNRSEDVPGLYLAGAGTSPAAGIPSVLRSAQLTTRLVLEDLGLELTPHAQPVTA